MEPRYRIVYTGRLVRGVDPGQVIAALSERFQVKEMAARKMIQGGGRHVLKHNLDPDCAWRYQSTLGGIGLVTELEPVGSEGNSVVGDEISIVGPFSTVAPDPARTGPPVVSEACTSMPGGTQCPKCGAVAISPVTGVCDVCGVVAERYLARLATEGRDAPDAEGAPDPGDPLPPPVSQPTRSPGGDDKLPEPRSVPAGRGWAWFTDAWGQLLGQPWTWVGALVVLLLVYVALGLTPVIGVLTLGILGPMLTGGLMIGAHIQWNGGRFEITHLLAGFSRNPGDLALVGVAYLGLTLLMDFLVTFALIAGLSTVTPDLDALVLESQALGVPALGRVEPWLLLTALIGLLLSVPLMMAVLFAPALAAIDRLRVGQALRLSLVGCWRNLAPLAVVSLIGLLLGAVTVLTLGLALLVAMPLFTLALYHAYRDIYRG